MDGKKVASIGLAIRDKISFHGVAINISKEVIAGFNKISPFSSITFLSTVTVRGFGAAEISSVTGVAT